MKKLSKLICHSEGTSSSKGDEPAEEAVEKAAEAINEVPMGSSEPTLETVAALNELPEYPKKFTLRRLLVFAGIVLGYSFFYLTRNSFTFAAPVMVADKSLNMDITKVGVITSFFPIAYGCSKFLSGVLGARTSPTLLLGLGLMATALVNITMGFGAGLTWFIVFWSINGVLQGLGGPACARVLTTWFASKERGTYWGMWNIAHNLGGFMAPIIAGTAAKQFGWRWGMYVPGLLGLLMGCFVLLAVRDSPQSIGYPPVEAIEVKPKKEEKEDSKEDKPSLLTLLMQNVLRNPYIWGMALTYFFIYVIRQGVTSWFVFYLISEKGFQDAGKAAFSVSGLEIGGLVGSLLAGRISDYLIKKNPEDGATGKRVQVVISYTVGIAAMLLAFKLCPPIAALQWFIVCMIGFFLYGPQMLIGLCGAELVGPESVGASEGFLGWIAYLGAANAGVPLSILVKNYGWNAYFTALLCACAGAILLLLPMVNLKSFV